MGSETHMENPIRRSAGKQVKGGRRRRILLTLFASIAVAIVIGVAYVLTQGGRAMNVPERVLNCPVAGTVAHQHDASCYDDEGNLVCVLPELEYHVHDDSCYEEQTVLVCGQEESEEHTHTDDCYEVTRELVCGKEEVTETHQHGPGCFEDVSVKMPEQAFEHKFSDKDDKVVLDVRVDAPEGALPKGTTMKAEWVNLSKEENAQAKSIIEKTVATKTSDKITAVQAVDITFLDADGNEVEPAKKVTVTFASSQIADEKTGKMLVHVESAKEAKERAEREGKQDVQVEGQVLTPLTAEQLKKRNLSSEKNELVFDASQFSVYAVAYTTSAPASAKKLSLKAANSPDSFTVGLVGYNFGGLYGYSSNARYRQMIIGYPDDLSSYADHLTFASTEELCAQPFTYAQDGFDLESIGLVQDETNSYAGYKYTLVGFVPVDEGDVASLTAAEYYSQYAFDTEEAAKASVTSKGGVLYGQKPSADLASALAGGKLAAAVWQEHSPRGIQSINGLTVTPNKLPMEDAQSVKLTPTLRGLQEGDYSDTPMTLTFTLSDGLTFSEGSTLSCTSSDIVIDQDGVVFSDDGKTVTIPITQVKSTKTGYVYPVFEVTLDVDSEKTTERVDAKLQNAWGNTTSSSRTVNIDRPTVYTTLDTKTVKELFTGEQQKEVLLYVNHGNATKGDTVTQVSVVLSDNVVSVESASVDSSSANTIDPSSLVVDGNGISYTVTKYGKTGTSADVIKLVLNVATLDEGEESREGSTLTMSHDGDTKALVTGEATIKVTEPYYQITVYGTYMAYYDQNPASSEWQNMWMSSAGSKVVKFYGSSESNVLDDYPWSMEEDSPLSSMAEYDSYLNMTRVGKVVRNPHTGAIWTCVGFVPVSNRPSGQMNDPANLKYHLSQKDGKTLADAQQVVADMNGVLYGQTPTAKQLEVWGYTDKFEIVWYVSEPSNEDLIKYDYTESLYTGRVPAADEATTDGLDISVSVTQGATSEHHTVTITYTIPEGMNKAEININSLLGNAEHDIEQVIRGAQPGDTIDYVINVVDQSGKYVYKPESGSESTVNYGAGHEAVAQGFEGFGIPGATVDGFSFFSRRSLDQPLRTLSEMSGVTMSVDGPAPTDARVGEALYKLGYGAIVDSATGQAMGPQDAYKKEGTDEPDYEKITRELLDDYYLDWYNMYYFNEHPDEDSETPHHASFRELRAEDYVTIFNAANGTQVTETNPVIVNARYYAFYEYFFPISGTGEEGTYKGSWTWMDNHTANGGNDFNAVTEGQWGTSEVTDEDTGTTTHTIRWYQLINGEGNGNAMQNTVFYTAVQFKLVRLTDVEVLKVDKDDSHALTGAKFKLTEVDKDSRTVANGVTRDETEVDEDGKLSFDDLSMGWYKLEETECPEGYVKAADLDNLTFAIEADEETGNIKVVFEDTDMVTFDDSTGTFLFTVKNELGAALPNTGGAGTGLLTALGTGLIAAAGALLARKRLAA